MLPQPEGVLQAALLWEGRMHLNRLELAWPSKGSAAPPRESVEIRVYPSPHGWFGWQRDQQVTTPPEVSADGLTWVYKGDWKLIPNGIDLPDGVGTMTWPDGRVYVGEFRNGRMDGKGKMVNPRGITQDGLWKRDYFVGPSP